MSETINKNWPQGLEERSPDNRNVIDHYKYWKTDAIKADLDEKRLPYHLLLENFAHDFNISTVIRNANAFLASSISICGRRKWDKRGAVGTHKYQHVSYFETQKEVIDDFKSQGFHIVAFDNVGEAKSIVDYQWAEKTLMIFGQEDIGVSEYALENADDIVYIPQLGSTRSLNVGCASSIAMYDYAAKCGGI